MADTQEQLLTLLTEVSQEDYVRIVKNPLGSPDSANVPLRDVIARIVSPYKINASIAGGNLTVEIVHASDGAAVSALRPMIFKIGDTFRLATSALTTTKNAGTNWGNAGAAETATQDIDWFVYVMYETGAAAGVKMFFSRFLPSSGTMNFFTNTTTNPKYPAGNWTNFNATDRFEVVGRFRAVLSAGAGFTWSFNSNMIIHRPIFETDWLTFVATVTSTTGTITTITPSTTIYKVTPNTLHAAGRFTVTNNGTGATAIRVTIPLTSISLSQSGHGYNATTNVMLNGRTTGGTAFFDWRTATGAYPAVTGDVIHWDVSALWI